MCRVRTKPTLPDFAPVSPVIGNPIGSVGPIKDTVKPIRWKSGGPFITPVTQKSGPISNQNNNNNILSPSLVLGSNNTNVNGSFIVGSNNTIGPNAQNIIVIGDNIYANQNNGIYFEGGYFNSSGEFIKTSYDIIEGGEDEVLYVMKENLIDVVDGTIDAIRNYGGDSKQRPIIDANITNIVEDNPPELP